MKPHTDYIPNNDFGLLLIGPPLSGKTTVAMQFPDAYIISTDHKIKNAVARRPKTFPWWYDYVDTDDAGKPVGQFDQWTRLTELVKKGCADPRVRTVIVDNLSDIAVMLQNHIINNGGTKLVVGGEKVFEQQHWQPFKLLMQRMIAYGRGSGKIFIVCCHETVERDEVTGTLLYQPLIPGQLRGQIGGMFTDVWRTEVETSPTKAPKYHVRTTPTPRIALGRSIESLPIEFSFTWEEFEKHMQGKVPAA